MATEKAITQGLNRIRADRPGLGLDDAVDLHWVDWFSDEKFTDDGFLAGVNFYLENEVGRFWPTVRRFEQCYRAAVAELRQARELAAGPCAFECINGFCYEDRAEPYPRVVLVPCRCEAGQLKRKALERGTDRGEK